MKAFIETDSGFLAGDGALRPSAVCHELIVRSPAVRDLTAVLKKIAATNSPVLLTGEGGVGKELFAEQIYLHSGRTGRPFLRVDCTARPEELLEKKLFGCADGDAPSGRPEGAFAAADGGTVFLDEIGGLPLFLQENLLRVIADGQFERAGARDAESGRAEPVRADVRVIAATGRNLEDLVRAGKFRGDLYFRLNVMPLRVPPLRERPEDIDALAEYFLCRYGREVRKSFSGFSPSAIRVLRGYRWPGNVRELKNAVERACIAGTPPLVQSADLGLPAGDGAADIKNAPAVDDMAQDRASGQDDRSLRAAVNQFKRAYIIQILEQCSWNQTKAGKILGIQRTYVSRLLNELRIRNPDTERRRAPRAGE